MSSISQVSKTAAPQPRSAVIISTLIIVVPIALALICLAARLDIIELSQSEAAAAIPAEARRAFADAYVRAYGARRPVDPTRLYAWRAVAAAARLSENLSRAERMELHRLLAAWRTSG